MKKIMISAVLLASLTACHTTSEALTQDVAITSAPKGAACLVKNENTNAAVDKTPGVATVTHSSHHTDNLLVSCKKDGAKGSASVAHVTDTHTYPSTVHIVVK